MQRICFHHHWNRIKIFVIVIVYVCWSNRSFFIVCHNQTLPLLVMILLSIIVMKMITIWPNSNQRKSLNNNLQSTLPKDFSPESKLTSGKSVVCKAAFCNFVDFVFLFSTLIDFIWVHLLTISSSFLGRLADCIFWQLLSNVLNFLAQFLLGILFSSKKKGL